MQNLPTKIYLQVGEETESGDFNDLGEITWCQDKVFKTDVEYIRVDLISMTEQIKKVVDIENI